jgi:hypothetical protein
VRGAFHNPLQLLFKSAKIVDFAGNRIVMTCTYCISHEMYAKLSQYEIDVFNSKKMRKVMWRFFVGKLVRDWTLRLNVIKSR